MVLSSEDPRGTLALVMSETCQYCEDCRTITPHSRRPWRVKPGLAIVLLVLGAWMLAIQAWLAAVFAFLLSVSLHQSDRSRLWHVACDRCRWNEIRHRPKLTVHSIIDIR